MEPGLWPGHYPQNQAEEDPSWCRTLSTVDGKSEQNSRAWGHFLRVPGTVGAASLGPLASVLCSPAPSPSVLPSSLPRSEPHHGGMFRCFLLSPARQEHVELCKKQTRGPCVVT